MVKINKRFDKEELKKSGFIEDSFEGKVKDTIRALEDGKKKKKKEEVPAQKKNDPEEDKNAVDADDNIETYYNYCVNTISLFYLVNAVHSAFHHAAHLAIL